MADKPIILYIEDDPASQKMIARMLEQSGYRVIVAASGLDGIDKARAQPPDLILTDIHLTDLNGREIATRLRADDRFRAVPIVALTAQANDKQQQELATAAGITGYLTKPINLETLLRQVKYYLSSGHETSTIDAEQLLTAHVRYTHEVVSRLEQRIRELESGNAELQKLDQMKENFIQITAHELRTPLTLLYGYNRLLQDHAILRDARDSDPFLKNLLAGMDTALNRMHVMIEEILITSRILTNQMDLSTGAVNLRILMERALETYASALRQRQITIHFEAEEWPTHIIADSDMIRLVLNNLMSNAIKFTPDGGNIYLQARIDDPGKHVVFSIRDTGIGINAEDHARIFDHLDTLNDFKLHSTSKTAFMGGGMGLGLPVSQGIIRAHGGTIEVQSERQDSETYPGSTFTVTLPLNFKQETVKVRV